MGLSSFVYNARKNTPQQQKFDPNKKLANFIDATKPLTKEEATILGKDGNGNGNGSSPPAMEKFNWEECPDLKKTAPSPLCRRFFSYCAKEKCKGRFPSMNSP